MSRWLGLPAAPTMVRKSSSMRGRSVERFCFPFQFRSLAWTSARPQRTSAQQVLFIRLPRETG